MWDLPGPGIEPMSPTLAGGFLTTEPQGKPLSNGFFFFKVYLFILGCPLYLFIYLFIYLLFMAVGSSFLCEGSPQLRQAGATPHRGAQASHHRGLSCCGAQAPDAQAQQLWLTGPAAPRHAGSSQTRARTRMPCISRQTLNHCATREAPRQWFFK